MTSRMSLRSGTNAPTGGGEEKNGVVEKQKASQEKQKMLLANDMGHFSMIRALHLADVITALNGFCGFLSILSSVRHCLTLSPPNPLSSSSVRADDFTNIYTALLLVPLGLFFDFMDGKVARWRKKSSLMGQELDSLADLISFGVAPATAAFALGLRTPLDTLALAFFVLCGLTRLARFNVTVAALPKDASGKSKYFEGFPIPTSLCLVGGMAAATWAGAVGEGEEMIGGVLGQDLWLLGGDGGGGGGGGFHPIATLFLVWGCLMVSKTVHIPKP